MFFGLDLNGRIGKSSNGYEGVHGEHSVGERNGDMKGFWSLVMQRR